MPLKTLIILSLSVFSMGIQKTEKQTDVDGVQEESRDGIIYRLFKKNYPALYHKINQPEDRLDEVLDNRV